MIKQQINRDQWAQQTRQLTREYVERTLVMIMWAEGSDIEFQRRDDPAGTWRKSTDPQSEPMWDWEHNIYRVIEGGRK